jgi:hypothetical protein
MVRAGCDFVALPNRCMRCRKLQGMMRVRVSYDPRVYRMGPVRIGVVDRGQTLGAVWCLASVPTATESLCQGIWICGWCDVPLPILTTEHPDRGSGCSYFA